MTAAIAIPTNESHEERIESKVILTPELRALRAERISRREN